MPSIKIDPIDVKILGLIQNDADLQVAELAELVGLSQTACWRRLQKLKSSGVISKSVHLIDRNAVNLGVTVFVAIRTSDHTKRWFDQFKAAVVTIPEVVEFYRMSGDVDYLLRVVVPDIGAYDNVYKRLIADVPLSDVSSSFAMEELKYTTALPLTYV